jgi:hypothetical protein
MALATLIQANSCDQDWSPIESAHATSEFCTFLAGFVFTGMVLVITERRDHEADDAVVALKLLLCAFLPLGLCAYLVSDTSGEHVCSRALGESVLDGAMLGIGAATILVAIVWLLSAYRRREVAGLARRVCYAAFGFVDLLICTSAMSYVWDLSPVHRVHVIAFVLTVAVAATVAVALWVVRHFPWLPPKPSHASINRAVAAILVQTAVLGTAVGLMLNAPASWQQPLWVTWSFYGLTLVFPTTSLILLMRAIPHTEGMKSTAEEKVQPIELVIAVRTAPAPVRLRRIRTRRSNSSYGRAIPSRASRGESGSDPDAGASPLVTER